MARRPHNFASAESYNPRTGEHDQGAVCVDCKLFVPSPCALFGLPDCVEATPQPPPPSRPALSVVE